MDRLYPPSQKEISCMDRNEALRMLRRHVSKEGLIFHCLSTAAVMRALAARMGGDPGTWEVIGILHDIDYEAVGGDMHRHGEEGCRMLLEAGVDREIAEAVRRHNDILFGDSDDPLDVALQAADNISGLVIAAAAVKGGKITEVTGKTLRKKFKEKAFAAGCRREKIEPVTRFMDMNDFFSLALGAMSGIRDELGLE